MSSVGNVESASRELENKEFVSQYALSSSREDVGHDVVSRSNQQSDNPLKSDLCSSHQVIASNLDSSLPSGESDRPSPQAASSEDLACSDASISQTLNSYGSATHSPQDSSSEENHQVSDIPGATATSIDPAVDVHHASPVIGANQSTVPIDIQHGAEQEGKGQELTAPSVSSTSLPSSHASPEVELILDQNLSPTSEQERGRGESSHSKEGPHANDAPEPVKRLNLHDTTDSESDAYEKTTLDPSQDEVQAQPAVAVTITPTPTPAAIDTVEIDVDIDASATTGTQHRKNFASVTAGASIMTKNPEMTGTSSLLLDGSGDSYALSRCDAKKYVVIGLSEEVLIDTLIISNDEKFSGSIHRFRLLGSDVFPSTEWKILGNFVARNALGAQTFTVAPENRVWVKYVKISWLSHYSNEYYCTWTRIRLHGLTQLEHLKQTLTQQEDERAALVHSMEQQQQQRADAGSTSNFEPERGDEQHFDRDSEASQTDSVDIPAATATPSVEAPNINAQLTPEEASPRLSEYQNDPQTLSVDHGTSSPCAASGVACSCDEFDVDPHCSAGDSLSNHAPGSNIAANIEHLSSTIAHSVSTATDTHNPQSGSPIIDSSKRTESNLSSIPAEPSFTTTGHIASEINANGSIGVVGTTGDVTSTEASTIAQNTSSNHSSGLPARHEDDEQQTGVPLSNEAATSNVVSLATSDSEGSSSIGLREGTGSASSDNNNEALKELAGNEATTGSSEAFKSAALNDTDSGPGADQESNNPRGKKGSIITRIIHKISDVIRKGNGDESTAEHGGDSDKTSQVYDSEAVTESCTECSSSPPISTHDLDLKAASSSSTDPSLPSDSTIGGPSLTKFGESQLESILTESNSESGCTVLGADAQGACSMDTSTSASTSASTGASTHPTPTTSSEARQHLEQEERDVTQHSIATTISTTIEVSHFTLAEASGLDATTLPSEVSATFAPASTVLDVPKQLDPSPMTQSTVGNEKLGASTSTFAFCSHSMGSAASNVPSNCVSPKNQTVVSNTGQISSTSMTSTSPLPSNIHNQDIQSSHREFNTVAPSSTVPSSTNASPSSASSVIHTSAASMTSQSTHSYETISPSAKEHASSTADLSSESQAQIPDSKLSAPSSTSTRSSTEGTARGSTPSHGAELTNFGKETAVDEGVTPPLSSSDSDSQLSGSTASIHSHNPTQTSIPHNTLAASTPSASSNSVSAPSNVPASAAETVASSSPHATHVSRSSQPSASIAAHHDHTLASVTATAEIPKTAPGDAPTESPSQADGTHVVVVNSILDGAHIVSETWAGDQWHELQHVVNTYSPRMSLSSLATRFQDSTMKQTRLLDDLHIAKQSRSQAHVGTGGSANTALTLLAQKIVDLESGMADLERAFSGSLASQSEINQALFDMVLSQQRMILSLSSQLEQLMVLLPLRDAGLNGVPGKVVPTVIETQDSMPEVQADVGAHYAQTATVNNNTNVHHHTTESKHEPLASNESVSSDATNESDINVSEDMVAVSPEAPSLSELHPSIPLEVAMNVSNHIDRGDIASAKVSELSSTMSAPTPSVVENDALLESGIDFDDAAGFVPDYTHPTAEDSVDSASSPMTTD